MPEQWLLPDDGSILNEADLPDDPDLVALEGPGSEQPPLPDPETGEPVPAAPETGLPVCETDTSRVASCSNGHEPEEKERPAASLSSEDDDELELEIGPCDEPASGKPTATRGTGSPVEVAMPEIGNDLEDDEADDEPVIIELNGEPQSLTLEAAAAELNELERLRGEVEELRTAQEQLREQYLRKLAEFDNYRKRTDREREELERTAGAGIIRELVPVLDNFDRALQHTEGNDTSAFRQGVEMIAKQLWDVLGRIGLAEIDPKGQPFQPEFHEAVQRVEDSDQEPGTVAWVLAKGYLFGGRLVRPAMVGVVVEPLPPADNQPAGAETEGGEGVDAS